MKIASLLAAAFLAIAAPAFAQTFPANPSPALTVLAGTNVMVLAIPATEFTDNTPISGTATFTLYGARAATPGATPTMTAEATGLTTPSFVQANLLVGTDCYYWTETVAGVESPPSATVCVQVNAAPPQPKQPQAPSSPSIVATPPVAGSAP